MIFFLRDAATHKRTASSKCTKFPAGFNKYQNLFMVAFSGTSTTGKAHTPYSFTGALGMKYISLKVTLPFSSMLSISDW
jgi:hypothetical protein